MTESNRDPLRVDVWVAMAEQFLDTETRHDIPPTAMKCLRAGLSIDQARHVWRYEVSPAVGFNVWDVAGEWAAWDTDWLVERIERLSTRWDSRLLPALRYRMRVHVIHNVWTSIERCMKTLLTAPAPAVQEQMSLDFAFLARHYFDFCPDDPATLDDGARKRLRSLYPEPFRHVFAPIVDRSEALLCDRGLRAGMRWRYG